MVLVIENLILESERRATRLIEGRGEQINDSAVRAVADHEFELQLEGAEFLVSDDVARSNFGLNGENPVLHGPPVRREIGAARAMPALARLAIPQQSPTLCLFLRIEIVGN